MSQRRTAVYIIIAASLVAGIATGRRFFFSITYGFAGLLLLSALLAWLGARWLSFTRQPRTQRAQVGGRIQEDFVLRNVSLLPKLWLEILDQSTLPGHQANHVIGWLPPGHSYTWMIDTMCQQRGDFTLGPVLIATGDPFGLFQAQRSLNVTSRLVVYPQMLDLTDFKLPHGGSSGGEALRRRTHYVTTNAAGVRDYVYGDSLNRIHWRSSARKGRLVVKEFELDPISQIWLLLDAEAAVQAGSAQLQAALGAGRGGEAALLPPSTEEYAITAAATLAGHFLKQDQAVGLITYAPRRLLLPAERGARQITHLLEELAVMHMQGSLPFDQMLQAEGPHLPRGATAVLITASTRETWIAAAAGLARRGTKCAAVVIDAETFGGRPGHSETLARLANSGILAYSLKRGQPLAISLGYPAV